jgi:hypothetical protein
LATGAELLAIAKLIKDAYEAYEAVRKLLDPDPATIRELNTRLTGLEQQVDVISRVVENLTYELRRSEAIQITRAVDDQRAAYTAALTYAADHPDDTAAEVTALAAALALASPSYYTFPGRTAGSVDRFDPRATLPSFILAVSAWLAIRKMNSSPWTATSKDTLSKLAQNLESYIRQIEAGVDCTERYTSFDSPIDRPHRDPFPTILDPNDPPPPPPPTNPACRHVIACMDSMAVSYEVLLMEESDGYCVFDGSSMHAQGKVDYLTKYYEVPSLRSVLASWLETARV